MLWSCSRLTESESVLGQDHKVIPMLHFSVKDRGTPNCSALHLLTSINYSHEKFEKILYLQSKEKLPYICIYSYICICLSYNETMLPKIIMAIPEIIGRLKPC